MSEQLEQFATAVDNLWSGSIYTKLLEYLLRILLRLHLTPNREQGNFERNRAREQKKQERCVNEQLTERTVSDMSSWKRKVLCLCNKLAELKTDSTDNKRTTRGNAIMAQLSVLNAMKPKRKVKNLPPIDQ